MEVLSRKKKRESHTMILLALEIEWDLKAAILATYIRMLKVSAAV